ncbi:MAG: hypothetical protein WCJ24_03265 [Candidatus Saccharibacteria bacterium]
MQQLVNIITASETPNKEKLTVAEAFNKKLSTVEVTKPKTEKTITPVKTVKRVAQAAIKPAPKEFTAKKASKITNKIIIEKQFVKPNTADLPTTHSLEETYTELTAEVTAAISEIINDPTTWEKKTLISETESKKDSAEIQDFRIVLLEIFDSTGPEPTILTLENFESVDQDGREFVTNLNDLIDTFEPEQAIRTKEILDAAVAKIEEIFLYIDLSPEDIVSAFEQQDETLDELVRLSKELLYNLGLDNSDHNAKIMLLKLVKAEYAQQITSSSNAFDRAEQEELGTYEHKFDSGAASLTNFRNSQFFNHAALGSLALHKISAVIHYAAS